MSVPLAERPTSILTSGGAYFDTAAPESWDGSWADVANGLAHVCRFGGQVERFYSVAEHSVRVARLVERRGGGPAAVLAALVHDAHEAYYGDVVRPIRPLVPELVALMRRFDRVVEDRLGLRWGALESPTVRAADDRLMRAEAHVLWRSPPAWAEPGAPYGINVDGWAPEYARAVFSAAFLAAYDGDPLPPVVESVEWEVLPSALPVGFQWSTGAFKSNLRPPGSSAPSEPSGGRPHVRALRFGEVCPRCGETGLVCRG